jgi:hypothetical protein
MTYMHPFSGAQDHPQDYVDHARKLALSIEQNEGVTAPVKPGSDPLPVPGNWYGVGGAHNNRTGQRQQGWIQPPGTGSRTVPGVLAHILNTDGNNVERDRVGAPRVFAGGWVRDAKPGEEAQAVGGKVNVLDQTDVTLNRANARKMTASRGEDAYFDAKAVKEVPVPKGKK